jgi:methionyl aminopeptidase
MRQATATAAIVIKSPREIELMRAAGRLVHQVLDELEKLVRPGVTTGELNATAERVIREAGATALFLGVKVPQARFPFPASICTSVNDEIVHGIPGPRVLRGGDIVSVDCGVRLKGYCGDSARTFAVGDVSGEARRLLQVTRDTLDLALREMRPGLRWSTVARKMQDFVEDAGFGVVREFVGHGIGRDMHEEPKVPNYSDRSVRKADFDLTPGITLAVEPMVTAGGFAVDFSGPEQWTIATRDGSLAAHFEHTVAVTTDGVDVLTDGR